MSNFLDWIFEPFRNYDVEEDDDLEDKEEPVIPKAKLFRPQTFDEYIGQEKAKNKLRSLIKGIKKRDRIFPHTIIYGPAGTGKTTLAKIMAKELDVPIKEFIASKSESDILEEIKQLDGGILFIDEVHAMERSEVEKLYDVMEDFTSNGVPLKPFTLIGATTEIGEVMKDRRPFYDRFETKIKLARYAWKDLSQIAQQYKAVMFPEDVLKQEYYNLVGKNCRGTPRVALSLLKSTIYLDGDILQSLENSDIIKDGFTEEDLKVLEYLKENEKGVGLEGLVSYLDTSKYNFMYEIEPYLVQSGLIHRTPRGRKISEKGLLKIDELKHYGNDREMLLIHAKEDLGY